ncbi:MAG TPA: sigma-70 family RNA polymerase sigma factor [Terriglobia bacterium]|nr:sigma-70 family RNA polymerase sigma factor [Terriglobia bacterium]
MESALTTTMEMAASRGRTEGIAAEEFDHIVRSHQQRVFRVLFSLARDRDAADNLTQECFLRAYQKRATFRGDASVETWLIRIAVNLARDHARNRRLAFWRNLLQWTFPPEPGAEEIELSDGEPSAERALLAREQLAAVESVLVKISPQQRLAFSLRFFEEMTLEEIAEAMQLEVGTVKAHLFRAVNAVRKKLKEQK